MQNAEQIIVALDCGVLEARMLAQQLKGHARWLKVGMTLYYQAGPQIVREFNEMGFKVFVDLKLHDIPHQVRGAAAALTAAGANLFTVHAAGGLEMMQAARAGAHEAHASQHGLAADAVPLIVAITVLTSLDAANLQSIGVPVQDVSQQVLRLARLAQAAQLDGVVASPQEAKALREELGAGAVIVTPGVRLAAPADSPQKTATADDQKRTATPARALKDGASYLVVGRPITAAANPVEAFRALVAAAQ